MSISINIARQELSTLVVGQPGTEIFLVPANKKAVIRSVTLVNVGGSSVTASLYVGAIPVMYEESVGAGDRVDYNTWKVLDPGDILYANASDIDVIIHVDGILIDK